MITGLIEVILYVEDMNAQVVFYRDKLGLPVEYPAGLAEYGSEFWVLFNAGGCKLALHGGGAKRLGVDTPKIVFGVDNIELTRQEFTSRNVELSEVRSPAPGISVCDGVDPEGNPFSIEQHGDVS